MSIPKEKFNIEVESMKAVCPLGEVVGVQMIDENKIPVISCEGGCFRGEVARLAAHLVGKHEPFMQAGALPDFINEIHALANRDQRIANRDHVTLADKDVGDDALSPFLKNWTLLLVKRWNTWQPRVHALRSLLPGLREGIWRHP